MHLLIYVFNDYVVGNQCACSQRHSKKKITNEITLQSCEINNKTSAGCKQERFSEKTQELAEKKFMPFLTSYCQAAPNGNDISGVQNCVIVKRLPV